MKVHPNLEQYASEPPTEHTLQAYKRHLDAHRGQGSIGDIPPAHQALVWERFYGELEEGSGGGSQTTAAPSPTGHEQSPKLNANKLQSVPQDVNGSPVLFVKDRLPSYPAFAPPELRIPKGYTISQWYTGNFEVKHSAERGHDGSVEGQQTEIVPIPFAHAPIIITARYEDISTGLIHIRVDWLVGNRWKHHIARKSVWLSGATIVSLADVDFPVSADNCKKVIKYIRDFEFHNLYTIPTSRVSSQMGWTPEMDGFVYGSDYIPTDAASEDTHTTFLAHSPGDQYAVDGYRQKGSMECWRDAVEYVTKSKYHRAELAIYASLAAPMLQVLTVPNFAIDWSYLTSVGKTTVLRLAASVWGAPDEREDKTLIQTWADTQNYIERRASLQSHLPLFLDESKLAKTINGKSIVGDVIYQLTSGVSKGKAIASASGISETMKFRTIVMTTGEHQLVDCTMDGGLAARVLSLWGPPFGETSSETAMVIKSMSKLLRMSYGHAGPLWIRYIADHRHVWHVWQEMLEEETSRIMDKMIKSAKYGHASRMAQYLALISVTYKIASEALEIPTKKNPVDLAMVDIVGAVADSDRSEDLLRRIRSWADSNERKFIGRFSEDMPPHFIAGAWPTGGTDCVTDEEKWEYIAFYPQVLENVLKECGVDEPKSILRGWRDEGILDVPAARKGYTVQLRIGKKRHRMVKFDRKHIDLI